MLLSDDVLHRLRRARDMLGDDSGSLDDIARSVAISKFHFIRQFHAVFGATPHQFRTRVRLDRAKQLLSRGSMSVTEVCMEVGFSSASSFTDLFTRRVGTAPSAYRRRAQVLVARAPQLLAPGCLNLMAEAFRTIRNFREAGSVRAY